MLIVADRDPSAEFAQCALWRDGIDRAWVRAPADGMESARRTHPRLVVVDLNGHDETLFLIKQLRADHATRPTAIAVVDRNHSDAWERQFDSAGATVVLPSPFDPGLWDTRLEELIDVPHRRSARIPVRIAVWSRFSATDRVSEGWALNISVRGILLEMEHPMPLSTRAEFSLQLPEQRQQVHAVGQVVRLRHGDGGRFQLGIEFQVLKGDARKRIARFVTSAVDDSKADEPDAWEAELRASEARKAAILDSSLDGILTLDHEGRVREFNAAAERAFGLRYADVLGRKLPEGALSPELQAAIFQQFALVSGTGESPGPVSLETVVRYPDGAEHAVKASISPAFAKGKLLVTTYLREVEDLERTAAVLRAQEERLRALFENSSDGLALVDAERRILYRGPANARITGLNDDQVIDRRHQDRVHPDDDALAKSAFARALREPRTPVTVECRAQHEDGSWRWLEFVYNNLLDEPSVGAIVVNFRDIQSRKEKEAEEARLRATIGRAVLQWRQTVDSLESALLIVDADGRIVRANRATRDLAALSFGELRGRPLGAFAGEPWRGLAEVAQSAIARQQVVTHEVRSPESNTLWSVTGRPAVGPARDEPLAVVLASDVTQVVELQERVRRGELMAAMGLLVAGVAHEVRSPLFGISATVDAYELKYAHKPEAQRFIETIRREIERMSQLTEELLNYGRPSSETKRPVRLSDVVEAAATTTRESAARAGVILEIAIPATLPYVSADERLAQVFHNLILNAIQHSPEGGRVRVDARKLEGEGPPRLECRVSDDGPGIPVGDRKDLFVPFFTRRRDGTGLGLSIVHRILEEHGGDVVPGAAESGGALMTVRLPALGTPPL